MSRHKIIIKNLEYRVIVSSTYLKNQIRTFEIAIIITPWVKLPLNLVAQGDCYPNRVQSKIPFV